MKNFILLTLLSLTIQIFAAPVCVQVAANAIVLSGSKSRMATPESLPTIQRAVRSIENMILVGNKGQDSRSKVYTAALKQLESLLAQGQGLIDSKAQDQNQVFQFFQRYTQYVDLPKSFADNLAHYTQHDYIRPYSESAFQERYQAFREQYKDPFEKMLPSLIENLEKRLARKKETLNSGFEYISVGSDKIPNRSFKFQYKYIFMNGILPLRTLFQDRERGKVYIGISHTSMTTHDGSHGDSASFERHDRLHAFTQKHYDQVLFDFFGADTLAKMKQLKRITHGLLQDRIHEYLAIEDRDLRDAIEVAYFAILHEQSRDYPYGLSRELLDQDRYKRMLGGSLDTQYFGVEYSHLKSKPEVIAKALQWIRERAEKDLKKLTESFQN